MNRLIVASEATAPNSAGGGVQLVDVGDLFAVGGEHHRQGPEDPSRPVHRRRRHELGEPVLAELPETQGVQQAGEHPQPGVGHQRLAGEGCRNGGEDWGRVVH